MTDGLKITWERVLKTEDCANDMEFEFDAAYRLLWEAGFVDEAAGSNLSIQMKIDELSTLKFLKTFITPSTSLLYQVLLANYWISIFLKLLIKFQIKQVIFYKNNYKK